MLHQLATLGYAFRQVPNDLPPPSTLTTLTIDANPNPNPNPNPDPNQVPNDVVDLPLPPPDTWREAAGPWERLPSFPTAATARRAQKRGKVRSEQ